MQNFPLKALMLLSMGQEEFDYLILQGSSHLLFQVAVKRHRCQD